MRTLVTGGAGFIGSHLVDRLVADGHLVTVVDNLTTGRPEYLRRAARAGACRLVTADITGPGVVKIVAKATPEVIFHLAAQIDVRASVADPISDASTNILGTVAVLEAARAAGVRKVVFVSSVAIFGSAWELPVDERTPTNPLSPYAVSKLAGESYLGQYRQLHGLDTTTVVLTNTYGPRQDPHGEAGVVAIFTAALCAARPTRLYGDGGNVRDYLFVADAVDALVRAAGPAGSGERLTIGTGVGTTDRDLHRLIAAAVGTRAQAEDAPARLGDLRAMVVNPGRAAAVLGWTPHTQLAEGIARTVAASPEPAPAA
ncbi:MAG TPA: GDP-mannose 4,6-dehydratase [Nocardioides sp.]|jgi:UDP-glucose 4-epimerase